MGQKTWAVALLLLFTFVLPQSGALAAPLDENSSAPKQNANCRWYGPTELAMHQSYNQYASIPLRYSNSYVPPHTYGDREYDGHGPIVDASVSYHVESYGIYADVAMSATETKSDWTTAKGSSRFWFFYPKNGYYINRVGQQAASYGSVYATNVSNVGASNSRTFRYTDTDHENDVWNYTRSNLVASVSFVGDTKGKEAGTRTGMTVNSEVTMIELCR